MKFGLSQLTAKTPRTLLKVVQFSAALGAALVAFFAQADINPDTEALVLKVYAGIASAIAIIAQFFGITTPSTYPTKTK